MCGCGGPVRAALAYAESDVLALCLHTIKSSTIFVNQDSKEPMISSEKKPQSFVMKLWWFHGEYRWRMLLLLVVISLASSTTLIPPWFLGKVIEASAKPNPTQSILLNSAVMAALLMFLHWFRVQTKRKSSDYRATISASARHQAIGILLSDGLREGRLVGNEVSRLDSGLRDFADLYRALQNDILFCLITFVGCVAVFLFSSPLLLLATIVYLSGCGFLIVRSLPRLRLAQLSVSVARESFSGAFSNAVSNSLSVQATGAEASIGKKVGSSVRLLEQSEYVRNAVASKQWTILNLLNAGYLSVSLALIGVGAAQGTLTISLVVVAYSYARELTRSVVEFMDISEGVVQSYVGFNRLLALLSEGDEVFSRPESFPANWKELRLENVSHRYPGAAHDVLKNISWAIPARSRVGLRGVSGSGKSTLIKVLLGLTQPTSGRVLVSSADLSQVARASLRREMAIALQECEILAFSLRENITLCRDVDESWLEQVIKACSLSDVVKRLPEGIDTLVGERGYQLSGGERQRVSLARAIVGKPSILVVDEATSMLDAETERRFFAGIEQLLPELTLLFVSHHDRAWVYATEIYELKGGAISKLGADSQAANQQS